MRGQVLHNNELISEGIIKAVKVAPKPEEAKAADAKPEEEAKPEGASADATEQVCNAAHSMQHNHSLSVPGHPAADDCQPLLAC